MKIAVVGSGISGLLAANLLSSQHEVHLLEAGNYPGGHTNTIDVPMDGGTYSVDTGFMVFNQRTYPNFCRMLDRLAVRSQESDMSFSVRCDKTGLEYEGSSLNGVFAQRSNLFRPRFWRMLSDILRFNKEATAWLENLPESGAESHSISQLTLGNFTKNHGYSQAFVEQYLIPMGAAIWSAPPQQMLAFPARFILNFYRNHGLLQILDRPIWRTIPGGAKNYVKQLLKPLEDRVRLQSPVTKIARTGDQVLITTEEQSPELFDAVVLACHADQSLNMLADPSEEEREILTAFPYQKNVVKVHDDTQILPKTKRAWASWNYLVPREAAKQSAAKNAEVVVTYDLSRLQKVSSPRPILATLNDVGMVNPSKTFRTIVYHHPLFGVDSILAQGRHGQISGRRQTYYCGAYWGAGFHEDGVNSALAVAKQLGITLEACSAASTKGKWSTADSAL